MQDQGCAQLSSPLRIYRGFSNDLNVTQAMFLLRMHDKETTLLIKPDESFVTGLSIYMLNT